MSSHSLCELDQPELDRLLCCKRDIRPGTYPVVRSPCRNCSSRNSGQEASASTAPDATCHASQVCPSRLRGIQRKVSGVVRTRQKRKGQNVRSTAAGATCHKPGVALQAARS